MGDLIWETLLEIEKIKKLATGGTLTEGYLIAKLLPINYILNSRSQLVVLLGTRLLLAGIGGTVHIQRKLQEYQFNTELSWSLYLSTLSLYSILLNQI